MEKRYIQWIDVARIFAAYLVIFAHLPDERVPFLAIIHHSVLFYARVPFFFIISGFFFCRKLDNTDDTWAATRTRLKSLIRPYIFYTLNLGVFSGGGIFFSHLADCNVAGMAQDLLHFLGLGSPPANIPLWFLRDLMVYIALTPFFIRIPAPVLLTVCLAMFAFPVLLTQKLYLSYPIPEYTGYYLLGIFLKKSDFNLHAVSSWLSGRLGLIISGIAALNIGVTTYFIVNHVGHASSRFWELINIPMRMLGILAIVAIACLVCEKCKRFAAWIAQYGRDAFFVYAAHFAVICFFNILYEKLIVPRIHIPDGVVYTFMEFSPLFIMAGLLAGMQWVKKHCPWMLPVIAVR